MDLFRGTLSGDHFYAEHFPTAQCPPHMPFSLLKGDRLMLIGDSITEARRFSLILETYLAVCMPHLEVEVRNLGKGGETAEGFLSRIDTECRTHRPTVAVICYGMNDAGYINHNRHAAVKFRSAIAAIAEKLIAAGARVVMTSPGCIGRLPSWEFVKDLNCTLDGINTSLMYLRDEAAAIAAAERLPFVDHFWNLYRARITALGMFGTDYAVCGADDGVHPSWAGHVVMAFGLFTALGFDGNLGRFTIDLVSKNATADQDHVFKGEKDGAYAFSSLRYPYCSEGLVDKDWFIRSGMILVPFNREFNRMVLIVTGTTAPRYRVAWTDHQNMLEEWHIYTAAELQAGVNLAGDFQLNPFSIPFRRINDLVFRKQIVESNETWHAWESAGKSAADGLAEYEAQRGELVGEIKRAFVPVSHHIRFEALQ